MIQLRKFLRTLEMIQPKIRFASDSRNRRRSGMTLIELLVAISILVIIAAILVPQLRFASADRNIREASRIVASLFASASQRAINDGEAGVVIERNPNIVDPDSALYAGTSLFMLRRVPRYIGEEATDVAELVRLDSVDFPMVPQVASNVGFGSQGSQDIFIPMPLEQEELGIVRVDDQISFNDQPNVRFRISSLNFTADEQTDVVDGIRKLRLRLVPVTNFISLGFLNSEVTEDDNGKSRLLIGEGKFVIYRQPRKLVSSRVDLPSGYLIDLRLSGERIGPPLVPGRTLFDTDDRSGGGTAAFPNSVSCFFNGRGGVDRMSFSISISGFETRIATFPREPVYLMVREYSTDDGGEAVGNVLSNEGNMWVTVDPVTGTANVVPGVPFDLGGGLLTKDALREARKLGSRGQAAQ